MYSYFLPQVRLNFIMIITIRGDSKRRNRISRGRKFVFLFLDKEKEKHEKEEEGREGDGKEVKGTDAVLRQPPPKPYAVLATPIPTLLVLFIINIRMFIVYKCVLNL